ncbi:MAG: nucleoside monophosphate kinase [Candidatus Paceibacterota bacterium]
MKSLKTIILIGSQGSGKGTQARNVQEYMNQEGLGLPTFLFSMGESFRQFAKGDGFTEDRVQDFLSKGTILPLFLPVWSWTRMFIENIHGEEHLIFDGSPRTLDEARVLESAFAFYGRESVIVLKLEVSRKEILERLMLRGREDDTEEALEQRVSLFEENSLPILTFFASNPRYRVVSINGEQDAQSVFLEIKTAIEKI